MALQNATVLRDADDINKYTSDRLGGGLPTQATSIIPRFFTEIHAKPGGGVNEVEMVELLIAGDSKNAPVHKVTDSLRHVYHEAYERWRKGMEMAADGTPLEAWPMMIGRQALLHLFKFHNVFTVEALALMPDTGCQSIGAGALDLRTHARAFVEEKQRNDPLTQQTQRTIDLEKQVAMLTEQLAALQANADKGAGVVAGAPPPAETGDGGSSGIAAEDRGDTDAPPQIKWNLGKKEHEVIVKGEVVFSDANKLAAEQYLADNFPAA